MAYDDHPVPIGYEATISQPYIVALMTDLLAPRKTDRVLEIGTGSGYQAAVLSQLAQQVYTIEIVPELAKSAQRILSDLGYHNVTVRQGDGYKGWPEQAPFDGIMLTAAPPEVPQALIDQLANRGRLVAPVGLGWNQELVLIEKDLNGRLRRRSAGGVVFVPMRGEFGTIIGLTNAGYRYRQNKRSSTVETFSGWRGCGHCRGLRFCSPGSGGGPSSVERWKRPRRSPVSDRERVETLAERQGLEWLGAG
jgi:protein-L-isoaspartate(D-aspartate) O-methyltransferase